MLASAALSLAFSIVASLSIGPYTLLLTCLELAAAASLGLSAKWVGWLGLLALGAACWAALIVPRLA
jgi:hypothetical protein